MRWILGVTFILSLLGTAATARISPAGGIGLEFDPSLRSTGMGTASNAVFWGSDPNYWANPALLGYYEGLQVHWQKRQLVPDLANDVFFESLRFSGGWRGIGVAFSAAPIGKLRLDQGTQTATGSNNQDNGEFEAYQEIRSFSLGVSLSKVVQEILFRDSAPTALHFLDIALGFSVKHFEDSLGPSSVTMEADHFASTLTQDAGILIRGTLIDTMDPSTAQLFPGDMQRLGLRIEFGYGYSVQNLDNAVIDFGNNTSDPIARFPRRGTAIHVEIGGPRLLRGSPVRRIARLITPLISISRAKDKVVETVLIADEQEEFSRITGDGFELTLLNTITWRWGNYSNPSGQIVGDTSGFGVGFDFDGIAGFRYDRSSQPQTAGFSEVEGNALAIFFDPLKYRAWRRGE